MAAASERPSRLPPERGEERRRPPRRRGKPPRLTVALAKVAATSAVPYGFTVAAWSAGALLINFRGAPNVGDVFLFVVGAVGGFSAIGWLAKRQWPPGERASPGREAVTTGMLNWFAVGLAVGAVALLAQIPSWVAWPLSTFAATTIYLLVAALELAPSLPRDG